MGGDYPTLTPQELAAAGRSLFGESWRAELARAFDLSEADILAVESGAEAAPPQWRAKLVALAQDIAVRALETASSLMWRTSENETVETAAALRASA
jgi:hypothetical protein